MRNDVIEAIYIHIPFCVKKCNYCDFLSFSPSETDTMERYIHGLITEIRLAVTRYDIKAKTIFIGGGTPSCLPEPLLQQLLAAIQQYVVSDVLQEYTVEMNPGTITLQKLQTMKTYGVNRLSIGVQSDTESQLALLGRIHTFAQAKEAIDMARSVGFDNVNLDFMYGIPGQTIEDWQRTLVQAIDLMPQHLSLYQLKIEEGTVLHRWLEDGQIREFDDEIALSMYRAAQEILQRAGYQQYEISNYAQAGFESLHNQVYWRTENYLGLGLGACSWIRPDRWNNLYEIDAYLQCVQQETMPIGEVEHLSVKEQMEETVFMALRMNNGLSKALFQQRFSTCAKDIFSEAIMRCKTNGWLVEDDTHYRLTEQGRVLGNLVFVEFI